MQGELAVETTTAGVQIHLTYLWCEPVQRIQQLFILVRHRKKKRYVIDGTSRKEKEKKKEKREGKRGREIYVS